MEANFSKVSMPMIGKRGATSMRGSFFVTAEDGARLHVMIDSSYTQKWDARHDVLIYELAKRLGVEIEKT